MVDSFREDIDQNNTSYDKYHAYNRCYIGILFKIC